MVNNYNVAKKYYEQKEYEKAYSIILELAKNKNVKAQAILASMLEEGKGVDIDEERALYWYEIAANNNHVEALYIWAIHNFESLKKIDEGKKYLEKSVSLNCPEAIHFLATCLEHGEYEYEKNEEKAIELYKQACLLKHKEACASLYSLLHEKNKIHEFREFVNRDMGQINMAKIILIPFLKNKISSFLNKFKIKR